MKNSIESMHSGVWLLSEFTYFVYDYVLVVYFLSIVFLLQRNQRRERANGM